MDGQGRTLSEQLADDIMKIIQEGAYRPGDKLPTEKELCGRLGAGRNTVREALKLLASRNVVVIRQGSGTFISEKQGVADDPFGFSMISDRKKLIKDILQARAIIEPPAAALAAQCASAKEIADLKAVLEEMEETMKKRRDYSALDMKFHTKIAECTHNLVMENLIPVIGNGVMVFAKEVGRTEYRQTSISHRKIFEYIANRQPFEAEMEMRYHILFNNNRFLNEQE